MAATQWYIEREGVEYGPCTWDGLQTLARQGTLRMTDLVRRDGDTYFVPAHQARCDAPDNPALVAPQPVPQPAPVAARKQISEFPGAAPAAQPVAAAEGLDALERAVEEDLNLALSAVTVSAPAAAAATTRAEPVVAVTRIAPAPAPVEAARVERAAVEPATEVVAPRAVIKTALPAQTIVELELDEVLAPVAPSSREPTPVNFTGPAVLALVCAVGGLFWFGLLLGFVSVVLAVNALRAMGRNGALAPRGVAMAALMLGAADLIVLVSAIATHARLATFFWN